MRVSLDVNIFVAQLRALQVGRGAGATSDLVGMVRDMRCEAGPIQLVLSWEMIATLQNVLERLSFPPDTISDFISSLILLMRTGPESFDPHLLPEGGRHLAMQDQEDAGVLASSIAARVDLLVTNNLDDFQIKDAEKFETRVIKRRDESERQLHALAYERADGVSLVVAHPIDARDWLAQGLLPTPDLLRSLASATPSGPPRS
ncbi:conserved protein of unknown function [Bradyrhizobium sp. ORS 285]|uniref:PIN domain-containing protein n=1 Tax=Bradyrhizobium sp. ORS 285 TaxID=115808 RepID=UPI0002408A84|nr:PIN domain-containing protein [Bradyrhizobium sp. ORS 285]CCD89767.1 conserved hypothetical protein [Bradyrhizobium sp. ORS 285]SMX61813.1 conserved protein of unknown function [Bradyrhizobium sp. ORS 285]